MGTDLTLVGKVTSTYATPTTSALTSTTDFTSTVAIGSGIAVNFSTTGPQDASPTSTLSSARLYTVPCHAIADFWQCGGW